MKIIRKIFNKFLFRAFPGMFDRTLKYPGGFPD